MLGAPDISRCFLCGSPGFPGTLCDTCIVQRPVFDDTVVAAKCARCTTPLEILTVGPGVGSRIFACGSCRWTFLPARAWSLLFTPDMSVVKEIETRVPMPTIRVTDALPLMKCPACAQPMDRARFAANSANIIDVCRFQHGVWVDAGELRDIVMFTPSKEVDLPVAHRAHHDVAERILQQNRPHLDKVRAQASRVPNVIGILFVFVIGLAAIVAGLHFIGKDCRGLDPRQPTDMPE